MLSGARVESSERVRSKDGAFYPNPPALTMYGRQLVALGIFYSFSIFQNLSAGVLTSLGLASRDPAHWQAKIGRLFQLWRRLGRQLGVMDIDFPDEKELQKLQGTIIAANHPTLVDAFVLLSTVPHAVCIMRSDLLANPSFSNLSRLAGYISNDRGAALIHDGINRLGRGENLIIFPEGTRSRQGVMNPFKRGFALMATRSGTPVQTIIASSEGEFFTKGSQLLKPSRLPVRLSYRLGDIFEPAPGESADTFARRLEAYFREQVAKPATDQSPGKL